MVCQPHAPRTQMRVELVAKAQNSCSVRRNSFVFRRSKTRISETAICPETQRGRGKTFRLGIALRADHRGWLSWRELSPPPHLTGRKESSFANPFTQCPVNCATRTGQCPPNLIYGSPLREHFPDIWMFRAALSPVRINHPAAHPAAKRLAGSIRWLIAAPWPQCQNSRTQQ